ncbi:MAG: hypothetical protein Q9191_005353 [Dirinaria sp. TL-2023a]
MAKRAVEDSGIEDAVLKSGERPVRPEEDGDGVDFEDEFEDEFDSEDEIIEAGVDGRPDEEKEVEEKRDAMDVDQRTFIPGRDKLAAGESLSPDSSAYQMLHTLTATWPCLSFDIIRDSLGDNRKSYPATLYAVAGTQAESRRAKENQMLVMKLSGLSRTSRGRDEDSSDEDTDDEEDAEPILETKSLPLGSTTNRIRAHQIFSADPSKTPRTLVATMLENSEVQLHDITPYVTSFDTPGTILTPQQSKPLMTLRMHKSEGYAVAWSALNHQGKLITGDNDGKIFVTSCVDGKWATDIKPFTGHDSSVEDLQWSPNERNVFASASSDGTIKIWDVRSKSHAPAISVSVSKTDVNVLSWSKQTPHLLATGAEDGEWAVWDLRQWKPLSNAKTDSNAKPKPVASFNFHQEQITSLEWHPTDDSIVAVAAGDNTLTLWDLAVELDDEESRDTADVKDVPPQLLFVHFMESVKECHWHPQIPGVVMGTGAGGFG